MSCSSEQGKIKSCACFRKLHDLTCEYSSIGGKQNLRSNSLAVLQIIMHCA